MIENPIRRTFANTVTFNVSKCKVLSITKKKAPSRFIYTMDGEPLELVPSHPYLGVTLASDMI